MADFSLVNECRALFRENPIQMIGGTWLALVGGTLFVVQRKKIPLQLKIIQARIVAQGALLGGAGVAAILSVLAPPPPPKTYQERYAVRSKPLAVAATTARLE